MGRLRDLLGSKRARGTLFAGSAVVIGLLIVVSIWEGPPTAEFDDPKDIDPVLLSHTSTRLVGYQKQEMVFDVIALLTGGPYDLGVISIRVYDTETDVIPDPLAEIVDNDGDGHLTLFDQVVISNVSARYQNSRLVVYHRFSEVGSIVIEWEKITTWYPLLLVQDDVIVNSSGRWDTTFEVVEMGPSILEDDADNIRFLLYDGESYETGSTQVLIVDIDKDGRFQEGDRVIILGMTSRYDGGKITILLKSSGRVIASARIVM
jgi:hypothetical protein